MPPRTRIEKENILNAAYEIVKTEGMKGVNARAIAARLGCSVQPIFYKFENMDELKAEVLKKVEKTYQQYILEKLDGQTPYKQMGKNYIRFAKEEPNLFKLIFMSESGQSMETFMESNPEVMSNVLKYGGEKTKLNALEMKKFHMKMWMFTHGIATLVANRTCELSDEQVEELLTEEYAALVLLVKSKL